MYHAFLRQRRLVTNTPHMYPSNLIHRLLDSDLWVFIERVLSSFSSSASDERLVSMCHKVRESPLTRLRFSPALAPALQPINYTPKTGDVLIPSRGRPAGFGNWLRTNTKLKEVSYWR